MKLLDSNILIYAPRPEYIHLRPLLVDRGNRVSEISRLEVLGYHKLTPVERRYYEVLFDQILILPITSAIIDLSIEYRQAQKMSVGDAIIAATAVWHHLELQTRNTSDFDHIPALRLHNPV